MQIMMGVSTTFMLFIVASSYEAFYTRLTEIFYSQTKDHGVTGGGGSTRLNFSSALINTLVLTRIVASGRIFTGSQLEASSNARLLRR